MKTSTSTFHVHPTPLPYCVLLEVAHRETQFELRDYRLVPEKPIQRFGYESLQFHGRFIRGGLDAHTFACGDRNGRIRLWDLRNPGRELASVSAFRDPRQKAVHVVFDDTRLIAASEDQRICFIERSQLQSSP